jgi:hypothetical protein
MGPGDGRKEAPSKIRDCAPHKELAAVHWGGSLLGKGPKHGGIGPFFFLAVGTG